MTAYILLTRNRIVDTEALAAYRDIGRKASEGHPVKRIAYYGAYEVLEGAPIEAGVALLEFPDMAAARAWYDSPAYAEASELRRKSGDWTVILFDGAAPGT